MMRMPHPNNSTVMPPDPSPPGAPIANSYIRLEVFSQVDGKHVFFKLKRSMTMRRLLKEYCLHRGFDYDSTRFLINGKRFLQRRTPNDLNLVDGDTIEAMTTMSGGVGGSSGSVSLPDSLQAA